MSFCSVDKLHLIKTQLATVPVWNRLTDQEQADIKIAILDGLEAIEQKEQEYKRMSIDDDLVWEPAQLLGIIKGGKDG